VKPPPIACVMAASADQGFSVTLENFIGIK
jgi:hypothetical protein